MSKVDDKIKDYLNRAAIIVESYAVEGFNPADRDVSKLIAEIAKMIQLEENK